MQGSVLLENNSILSSKLGTCWTGSPGMDSDLWSVCGQWQTSAWSCVCSGRLWVGCEPTRNARVCVWIQLKNKVCPWRLVFWPLRPSSHCSNLFLTPRFQTLMFIHSSLLLFMSSSKCRAHIIIFGSYSLCKTGDRTQWVFNPPHIYATYTLALAPIHAGFNSTV